VAPNYSAATLHARMLAVVNQIDGGGSNGVLQLLAGPVVVCRVTLARPSGAVVGATLTLIGTPITTTATGSGTVTSGRITDSNGNLVISGLTVGGPSATADILIASDAYPTVITAGNAVTMLAGQIQGA
jgi:hypothetical protein